MKNVMVLKNTKKSRASNDLEGGILSRGTTSYLSTILIANLFEYAKLLSESLNRIS